MSIPTNPNILTNEHPDAPLSSSGTSDGPIQNTTEPRRRTWFTPRHLVEMTTRDRSESIPLLLAHRTDSFANESRYQEYYGDASITPAIIEAGERALRQEFSRDDDMRIVWAIKRLFESIFNVKCLEDMANWEAAATRAIFDYEGIIELLIAFLNMNGDLNPRHPGPLRPNLTDLDYDGVGDQWRPSGSEQGSTDLLPHLTMRLNYVLLHNPTFGALYVAVTNLFARQLHEDMAYLNAWPSLLDETYASKEEEAMSGVDHCGSISALALSLARANRVDKVAHIMSAVASCYFESEDYGLLRGRLQKTVLAPLRRAIRLDASIVRK
ncbi:hypothetical protein IAT38_007234 [Cryptococcus sp. DSM 104549]